MTHRPHPISGRWPDVDPERNPDEDVRTYDDPPYAILYDDCDRCSQHAKHLTSLDDSNLAALWTRMVAVKNDETSYRTATEADAGDALYRLGVLLERLAPGVVDPWTYPLRIRVPEQVMEGRAR